MGIVSSDGWDIEMKTRGEMRQAELTDRLLSAASICFGHSLYLCRKKEKKDVLDYLWAWNAFQFSMSSAVPMIFHSLIDPMASEGM